MIWIVGYVVLLSVVLLWNHCAGTLNKEAAERLGEDYYGE
jgi:hypothetical protein